MSDLEDEFARLLAEGGGGVKRKKSSKVPAGDSSGGGVVVPDSQPAGRSAKGPAPVRGGLQDRPAKPVRPKPAFELGTGDERPEGKGPVLQEVGRSVPRSKRGSTESEWSNPGGPFIPVPIPESRFPKRFHPGELSRGDSVWYRGERYYVDYFPTAWVKGTFAKIVDKPIRTELSPAEWEAFQVKFECTTFCVPVDTLEKAPVTRNVLGRQPTKTAVERAAQRKATGTSDIGDPVAVMLRECPTLDSVYECAATYLDTTVKELKARYSHLNAGQQRMNLGNKMRFKAKTGRGL